MGIDGKYLNGEDEIFIIGEVEDKEFLGVTPDNSAVGLETILKEEIVRNGKKVKAVNMDISKLLRGVSQRVFPHTDIVTDKFHVIKYVNRVIDICRVATEKQVHERFEIKRLLLMKTERFHRIKHKPKWKRKIIRFEAILKNYPEIKLLWDLKNKIHGFYRCKSIKTAKHSWNRLLQFLDDNTSTHPEFIDLKRTFLNWKQEILNYFIYRTTNAAGVRKLVSKKCV